MKLKPCPFCGEHPEYNSTADTLVCEVCGIEIHRLVWGIRHPQEKVADVIDKALKMAAEYGGFDGAHHKDWVIDQMVRILVGDGYDKFIADVRDGKDGPNTYSWDCGIPP